MNNISTNKNSEYSEKIIVISLARDVQTSEVMVTLQSEYRGKTVIKTVSRDTITVSGLRELSKYGFPTLTKTDIDEFLSYFTENESDFPMMNIYQKVGWHEIGGKDYFLHRKPLADGKAKNGIYKGKLDLSRKGSIDDVIIFFDNNLRDAIGLQTACAVSLASAIVGRVKNKDLRFIFHIEGTSTSGKTTTLKLAGSLWGNPQIMPNELVQSAGGNNGVLICLDELAMSNTDNTQLTYLLTGGNDKQRMTNDDSSDDSFNTVFMSTGEIQFRNSNYGGITVRLFEVKACRHNK